jgi:hypothetical protein
MLLSYENPKHTDLAPRFGSFRITRLLPRVQCILFFCRADILLGMTCLQHLSTLAQFVGITGPIFVFVQSKKVIVKPSLNTKQYEVLRRN